MPGSAKTRQAPDLLQFTDEEKVSFLLAQVYAAAIDEVPAGKICQPTLRAAAVASSKGVLRWGPATSCLAKVAL